MSADKYFLDTNIFIYSFDEKHHTKRQKAMSLIEEALTSQGGVISFQVIQEFLNTASRKLPTVLSIEDLKDYLQAVLLGLCNSYPSLELYQEALQLHKDHRVSFYDALILASAISTNCKTLYTEDLNHGQVIAGIKIHNPFL